MNMKRRRNYAVPVFSFLAMMVLILDSKTALSGAKDGVELCLYSVIPSLFPFFIFSVLLTSSLSGKNIKFLHPLGRLCGMPRGSESILVIGFLGGYPVGAQAIANAYEFDQISKETAHRLLGFCSNAGPAFLFGMLGAQFSSRTVPWVLWTIHIASALIVGMLLPGKDTDCCVLRSGQQITFPQAVERSLRTMANVCGWVIIFRVIIAVLNRWVMWLLPQAGQVLLSGILELSNGCISLQYLPLQGSRFIFAASMLSLGGLCVAMQTATAVGNMGTGMYFPGKILQCFISILLSCVAQPLLFNPSDCISVPPAICIGTLLAGAALIFYMYRRKKVVAICT